MSASINHHDDQESFEYILDDLKREEDSEEEEENLVQDIVNTVQLRQLSIFSECSDKIEWDENVSLDLLIKLVLSKLGLKKSLVEFNKEWNLMELSQERDFKVKVEAARNIIHQTDKQKDRIDKLQINLANHQHHIEKLRRQRDSLRLHNHRLTEDNRQLICQIRYLKTLSQSYAPAIEEGKKRVEKISKDNLTMKLERDRLRVRVRDLEKSLSSTQAQQLQSQQKLSQITAHLPKSTSESSGICFDGYESQTVVASNDHHHVVQVNLKCVTATEELNVVQSLGVPESGLATQHSILSDYSKNFLCTDSMHESK